MSLTLKLNFVIIEMMNPKIIYEDDQILVIDKPSGMTVNKSETTKNEVTIQDWIEQKLRTHPPAGGLEPKVNTESDFYKRAGIVHRLDKETSGLLLIAKTEESFENLQKQFKERKVKKTYLALVHGKINEEEGEISIPIGRLPWNRTRFGILAEGREARTKYKVLCIKYLVSNGKKEPFTFLKLYPETGRTHQIRVHLKYMNHPVFADPLYAGRKTAKRDRKILPRLFLHAAKIEFCHPHSNKQVALESPLPSDLENILTTR